MGSWETTKRRHGTPTGWSLHKELGERPCDPCYRAQQAYDAERRTQPRNKILSRLHAKAQRLALKELSHRYPDEYRSLYEQHKAELGGEQP